MKKSPPLGICSLLYKETLEATLEILTLQMSSSVKWAKKIKDLREFHQKILLRMQLNLESTDQGERERFFKKFMPYFYLRP